MDHAVGITPLNYQIWYQLGNLHVDRGDLLSAEKAFREAFKLAPNHPEIASSYLDVLIEGSRFEEILWVDDLYSKASIFALPLVQIKTGNPRSPLLRKVLKFSGIPVEHAGYTKTMEKFGLKRGSLNHLEIPGEMFKPWSSDLGNLFVQLRFENIYDGLAIDGLKYTSNGKEITKMPLADEQVSFMHQSNSGGGFYAEIDTGLVPTQLEELTIIYSCPEHRLPEGSLIIIKKAKLNLLN